MKRFFLILLTFTVLAVAQACRPVAPAKDRARITADRVEVKKTRATLSTVVARLTRGDEVDVLSRESHWLRVRTSSGQEGWIEDSVALDQSVVVAEENLVAKTRQETVQAVGELSSSANLHIQPGRDTPVFKRLPKGERVEVFDRELTDRPLSAKGGDTTSSATAETARKDPWLKIRSVSGEAGWVYSPSVNFNVPEEVAAYSESRRIVAWLVLNQLALEDGKKVNQYVVADVAPGIAPNYDFDRIRVFTWNKKRSRYETAFRLSKITGYYPIRVLTHENNPAFEVPLASDAAAGASKTTARFVMKGVLVRPLETDQNSSSLPAQRRRRRR